MNQKARHLLSAFIIISVIFSAVACKRVAVPPQKFFRFIDLLGQSNILSSPLLNKTPGTLTTTIYPVDSSPIAGPESGRNPLCLKRKLIIGPTEIKILFAPPRSEYRFELNLPEDGVLDFGIGIIRDQNFEKLNTFKSDKYRAVNFLIVLEMEGRKKTIFQKKLKLPPRQESRTFNYLLNKVDLPKRKGKARLSFITGEEQDIFSFWFNPILYSRSQKRINVILVSIDTLRADHLGVYGYGRDTSPSMDALAKESAVFLNTYAPSPWTLPSHVSMMTALLGVKHQIYHRDERMDPSLLTLADILRKNGYVCSAVTGGAFVSSFYGFSQGFDSFDVRGVEVVPKNLAEQCLEGVSEWLDQLKDKNFFLFVHTYQPHLPYESPPPYNTIFLDNNHKLQRFDIATNLGGRGENGEVFKKLEDAERENVIGLYDGEVRYTDEKLIKPLVEKLRQLALYDRTMLVVTSDHGEQFYDHRSWGHGNFLYDDSLKVPLIIKFPDAKFRGQKCSKVVRLIDILPTILEEMGITFREADFDGRSLLPILSGREDEDRAFLADVVDLTEEAQSSRYPQRIAMNSGTMKLILNREFRKEYIESLVAKPPSISPLELYDLGHDPEEKKNIAGQRAEMVRQMKALIDAIYKNAQKKQPVKTRMAEEIEKQLKALGYIH